MHDVCEIVNIMHLFLSSPYCFLKPLNRYVRLDVWAMGKEDLRPRTDP